MASKFTKLKKKKLTREAPSFFNTLPMLVTTFNIIEMLKLFLIHANMQDANFGQTTAALEIPKTSTSLSYL